MLCWTESLSLALWTDMIPHDPSLAARIKEIQDMISAARPTTAHPEVVNCLNLLEEYMAAHQANMHPAEKK